MKRNMKAVILFLGVLCIGIGSIYIKIKSTKNIPITSIKPPTIEIQDIIELDEEEKYLKDLKIINVEKLSYLMLQNQGKALVEMINNQQGEWVMKQPYASVREVENIELMRLANCIPFFKKEKFIEKNALDLNKYGLKNPSMELIVKDNKDTMHILFGKEYDNMVYFKEADSNNVYSMNKAIIEPLKKADAFSLIDKLVYTADIEDIDEIKIESPIGIDIILIDQIEKELEDGTKKMEIIGNVNDEEIELETLKAIYEQLVSVTIDTPLKRVELSDRQAEITITYKLNPQENDGEGKEVVIEYIPYDSDFYLLRMNGHTEFAVMNKNVTRILQAIHEKQEEVK